MLRFTVEQLEVLDAIAREGSFAAAGRATHRSTPAVSYAVKGLEDALGLPLFDRSGHRARLTPAGRLVLGEARRVLDRGRELEQVAGLLQQDWEPELVVVVDGLLPMDKIMGAVRQLAELGAPTRIRVRVEYLTGVPERFVAEQAALMVALDLHPDPAFLAVELPPVALRLCVQRDHALAEADGPLDRAALAEHVELVVADSGRRGSDGQHRLWLGSPHVFEVSDFHTKVQAVRAGVGFGWLPEHLVLDDILSGELVALPFVEGGRHAFTPQLVRWAGRPRGRAARFFAECVLEALGVG